MRSRVRQFRDMGICKSIVTAKRYSNGLTSLVQADSPVASHLTRIESISDEVNSKNVASDRAKLRLRISLANRHSDPDIRRSVSSDIYTAALQVHRCAHSVEKVTFLPEQVFLSSSASFLYTHTSINGYQLYEELGVSSTNVSSLITKIRQSTPINSVGGFMTHDWFALLDGWHEACNSLIPSASLVGESIVENGIFIDAFKAVLNPSKALKIFLEAAFEFRKKKTPLGKVVKALRTSSDSFLSYNFGIRPAIQEIRNLLDSHRKVKSRLAYLRDNVGGYVPVRVRGILPSIISTPSYPAPGTYRIYTGRDSVGVISALAKVRHDLDYAKDWHAYVQYFGLHKAFGLAWELVPFSFVLDWVTNAGEYINKYATPKFDSPFYNIRNICYSTKEVTNSEFVMAPNKTFPAFSSTLLGSDPVTIGKYSLSAYNREPGLPETSGSVDFTRLGTFHALASGALLIQKLTK